MASVDSNLNIMVNKLNQLMSNIPAANQLAGTAIFADVQQDFVNSTGPGGSAWEARKAAWVKGIGFTVGDWKLLWKKGTLFRSITMESSDTKITIGTNVEYAKWLNEGTRKMVARPFFYMDDSRNQLFVNIWIGKMKENF
jgi:phage gpG-like protein